MYPNLIVGYNIGPNTYIDNITNIDVNDYYTIDISDDYN